MIETLLDIKKQQLIAFEAQDYAKVDELEQHFLDQCQSVDFAAIKENSPELAVINEVVAAHQQLVQAAFALRAQNLEQLIDMKRHQHAINAYTKR